MKALLYSASGQVIASEATVDDYRALLIDSFGAIVGLIPPRYRGTPENFAIECESAIFALIGQAPIERRFGITMTPKAQETTAGES